MMDRDESLSVSKLVAACLIRTSLITLLAWFMPCSKVLNGARFMHLFEEVEVSNFEVASDAFSTFKVCTWF